MEMFWIGMPGNFKTHKNSDSNAYAISLSKSHIEAINIKQRHTAFKLCYTMKQ